MEMSEEKKAMLNFAVNQTSPKDLDGGMFLNKKARSVRVRSEYNYLL